MLGKCSTTRLQFIINFLEPSQSFGPEARASRIIPFHWQMWLCGVSLCLFTCFLSASRAWGSLRKHVLPADRQAHTLSAGKIQQSQIGEHYDLMIGKWVTACLDIKNILHITSPAPYFKIISSACGNVIRQSLLILVVTPKAATRWVGMWLLKRKLRKLDNCVSLSKSGNHCLLFCVVSKSLSGWVG